MLEYTGHPFVDIGVATIVAFADKKRPEELALEDLEAVADYLEECYTQQPMTSFLTVVFPNSGFTQPAYNRAPEKRLRYARKVYELTNLISRVLELSVVFLPVNRRRLCL